MARLLFFLAIAFLVGLLFRALTGGRGTRARRDEQPPPPAAPPVPARTDAELLHQCAWCGVHMTGTSALALPDGRAYCSAEHREAALAARERS